MAVKRNEVFHLERLSQQDFETLYFNTAPAQHNNAACEALHKYHELCDARDKLMFEQIKGPRGRDINGRRLDTPYQESISMRSIAQIYNVTVDEMKAHWRCIENS